ncbi:MAG: dUTP diphosphatase [Desulfobacterales bacterium]|nr:dUTP diphosphatase [Desulfobacterales bacterium]
MPTINFLRVRPDSDADIPLPRYMTSHASGMDVCAAVEKELVLETGDISLIPTGFAVGIPEGFEIQIRPRSGLAAKHGIGLINSPGTIDSDFRGEVMLPVINLGKVPFTIRRGERIAQMVIQKIYRAELKIVEQLDETGRNTGGFGHTGVE